MSPYGTQKLVYRKFPATRPLKKLAESAVKHVLALWFYMSWHVLGAKTTNMIHLLNFFVCALSPCPYKLDAGYPGSNEDS